MGDRLIRRCLVYMLAGCILCSGRTFADDSADPLTEVIVEQDAEEPDIRTDSGTGPEEEKAAEMIISEDTDESAGTLDGGMADTELSPETSVLTFNELVGAKWTHYIELDTQYDFVCYNGSEYHCYVYNAVESGTYCVDLTKTSGRVRGEVYESTDGLSLYKTDEWSGYYDTAGFHINLKMKAGMKYVFKISPDTNKADQGKFRMRRATKEVASVSVSVIGGKYLAAGYTADGEWGTEEDGTTDYTRWEFDPARMLDMYKVTVTFADRTKYTWTYAHDGFTIGTTDLCINAIQDFDGWTVGDPAYCFIRVGGVEEDTRVAIPYVYFTDVQDPSHAYYRAIYWAAGRGITRGYSDNTFGIDRACTRGEAVMFLWKVMGRPEPKAAAKSPFKDVETTHSFYKAILWASQKEITKGFSDGTFGIDRTCTRGQIMTFIWRAKGQPLPKAVSGSPFSDVNTGHAYYKAILWGSQKGITKGFSDGTFGIDKNCTRGQIVTFLYRS